MKSRMSGTYQVMPKVGMERASQTDESASSIYKGKGESRLFSCKTTFFCLCICIINLIVLLSIHTKRTFK